MRFAVASGVVVGAVLAGTAHLVSQPRAPADSAGLSGYVLGPDWLPVQSGTVSVMARASERVVSTGSTGRFRIEALAPGVYDVSVSAARLMTLRLKVAMPPSGRLALPPIQLSTGSYVRVRFLSSAIPTIEWPHIIRTSFDLNGARIPERPGEWGREEVDPGGTATIGPLPRGMAVLAFDTPPFARMRLRDVRVTGESPLVDVGTVIVQSGAVLNVYLVDGEGVPVRGHDVYLEDSVALSPLSWAPVRTDATGRASFERLASGRYHVRTGGVGPCGNQVPPTIGRVVDAPPHGTVSKRLVIGGSLKLRLLSGGVPLAAKSVSVTLDSPSPALPAWLRQPDIRFLHEQRSFGLLREAPCFGRTDGDGRVRIPNVPPGPARAAVRIGTSTWVRRLEIPADAREIVLQVASGVLPVRVLHADSGEPIDGATITWMSGGVQVEAVASVTGDALLHGVSDRPGALVVEARNHQRRELKLASPPDVLHEVRLERAAPLEVRCRVVTEAGAPLAGALVELAPHDRLEVPQIATTDRDGMVRFSVAAPGPVRLTARADRYAASVLESVQVPAKTADSTTVSLSRGHRIVVTLEASRGDGPYALRVVNEAGGGMDAMLDARSDRVIQSGGRASLGPLPLGRYIVKLQSGSDERKESVRIEDHDVHVTFR